MNDEVKLEWRWVDDKGRSAVGLDELLDRRRFGAEMSKHESDYNDGFSDGVILALQMMASGGDGGGTGYVELLETADEEKIIARAKSQKMMRLSGLSDYLREKRSNAPN